MEIEDLIPEGPHDEDVPGAMTEEEKTELRLDQEDDAERGIEHTPIGTIDVTPRGCQTPEGNAHCEAALEAWRSWDAQIVNHLSELLVGTEVESLTAEDVYVLRGLLVTRYAKQEAFVRAVAGR